MGYRAVATFTPNNLQWRRLMSQSIPSFNSLWNQIDAYLRARIPVAWIREGSGAREVVRAKEYGPLLLHLVARNPFTADSDQTEHKDVSLSWLIDIEEKRPTIEVEALLEFDPASSERPRVEISFNIEAGGDGVMALYAYPSFPDMEQLKNPSMEEIYAYLDPMIEALHRSRWPGKWRK